MQTDRRRRGLLAIVAAVLVLAFILGAWGMYAAGSAGMLPWQPEPTRIAITPFADLPGSGALATPAP